MCIRDSGSTWYLRGCHLHSPALPDTKRVGRGLLMSRSKAYRRVSCFWSPCWQFSTWKRKFRRVQQREKVIPKDKTKNPHVFPIAAVWEYLQPISFLNNLERKLCNIAFPLSSVYEEFQMFCHLFNFQSSAIISCFPCFPGKTKKRKLRGKKCSISTARSREI